MDKDRTSCTFRAPPALLRKYIFILNFHAAQAVLYRSEEFSLSVVAGQPGPAMLIYPKIPRSIGLAMPQ